MNGKGKYQGICGYYTKKGTTKMCASKRRLTKKAKLEQANVATKEEDEDTSEEHVMTAFEACKTCDKGNFKSQTGMAGNTCILFCSE